MWLMKAINGEKDAKWLFLVRTVRSIFTVFRNSFSTNLNKIYVYNCLDYKSSKRKSSDHGWIQKNEKKKIFLWQTQNANKFTLILLLTLKVIKCRAQKSNKNDFDTFCRSKCWIFHRHERKKFHSMIAQFQCKWFDIESSIFGFCLMPYKSRPATRMRS